MSPQADQDFSPWLERRIPFLYRSRENPAYQAFRDRRRRLGWLPFTFAGLTGRRTPSPSGCAFALALGFFLLIPLLLLSPFGSPRQVILFGVLGLGTLIVAVLWSQKGARRTIPLRAAAAFNPESPNPDVALDLWMCGVNGRQIAEAATLENLESVVLSTALLQVLGSGVFLLVLLAPAPLGFQIAYVSIILLLGIAQFLLVVSAFPYGPQKNIVRALNSRWRRSDDLWTKVRREFPRQLREFAVTVCVIILVIFFLIVGVNLTIGIIRSLPEGVPAWVWLQALGVFLAAILVALSAVMISVMKPREERNLEKVLSESAAAFEIYIRCEILQDPDARRTLELAEMTSPGTSGLGVEHS